MKGNSGISLVKFTKEHVTDEYIEWLNDREVNKFLDVGRFPVEKDSIIIPDGINNMRFAILSNGLYIGTISLHRISWVDRKAETGYMLGNKEFWGKGIISECIRLIVDYGFNTLGLHKITAGVVDGNIGSEIVLEKNGFKKYATDPEDFWLNGKFLGTHRFYILSKQG